MIRVLFLCSGNPARSQIAPAAQLGRPGLRGLQRGDQSPSTGVSHGGKLPTKRRGRALFANQSPD